MLDSDWGAEEAKASKVRMTATRQSRVAASIQWHMYSQSSFSGAVALLGTVSWRKYALSMGSATSTGRSSVADDLVSRRTLVRHCVRHFVASMELLQQSPPCIVSNCVVTCATQQVN